MKAKYNGRNYMFRECDTEHVTQEELQRIVDETGRLQYDVYGMRVETHLVVKGIGYGWEVE